MWNHIRSCVKYWFLSVKVVLRAIYWQLLKQFVEKAITLPFFGQFEKGVSNTLMATAGSDP